MPVQMQRIYLRFLISTFRVKFTPLYATVQKAIGELLEKYHDTLIEELFTILDSFDVSLRIGPLDNLLAEELYPNYEEENLPKYRSFVILDVQNGEENSDSIDNRFTYTIIVYQNIMKSLGCAIESLPKDTQNRLTKRFMTFIDEEFLSTFFNFNII